MPGPSGGHSWHPMAYSPLTRLAYIPALSVPGYYNHDESYSYRPGFQNTGIEEGITDFGALNPQGVSQQIRFGIQLLAWDPQTQSERWRVDHSDLGGGTLATAGNLVFQGLGTGEFAAYAADTGDKLWSFQNGTTTMAGPVSYGVDEEQYIAVLAGRGGGSGLVGGPMGKPWQGVINENRILVFKLGGAAALPARQIVEQTVTVPEELRTQAQDEQLVANGKNLYEHYCYMCHGLEAMSGGVLPDLRFADAEIFENWDAIVIDGLLIDQGMRSFADVMSTDDAHAIRAYVLAQAARVE